MNARTEFVAPPYVANMHRVDSDADIDEILRSEDFMQGSHRESGVFFNGSLLLIEGHEHMQRRQLFSTLVSRTAMQELRATGRGTDGTMIRILRTLYEAGAGMVAASPPQRVAASYHDAYASFPLVLRSL